MPPNVRKSFPPAGVPNGYVAIGSNGAARIPQFAGSPTGPQNGDFWIDTVNLTVAHRIAAATRLAEKTSSKNVAGGYAGLDAGALVPAARLPPAADAALGAVLRVADVGALTDSTGGTVDGNISATNAVSAAPVGTDTVTRSDVPSKSDVDNRLLLIRNNFADVAAQINAIRAALRAAGVMP